MVAILDSNLHSQLENVDLTVAKFDSSTISVAIADSKEAIGDSNSSF